MIGLSFHAVGDEDISSEEHRGRTRHYSKREIGCLLGIVVVAIVISAPIINGMIERSEDTACRANLHEIGKAMLLYSAEYSDRLPPVYNMNTDEQHTPALVQSGNAKYPVTWATQIQGFMIPRASFLCRSASPEETVTTIAGREGEKTFVLSYGMYRGLSTAPVIKIPDQGGSVLIAETSNNGAKKSYDPLPFGPNHPDGFLIGWNDDNYMYKPKGSEMVTRLAFRDAQSGYGGANVKGRHQEHINAITVSGAYKMLHAFEGKVDHDAARLSGRWWADPNDFN